MGPGGVDKRLKSWPHDFPAQRSPLASVAPHCHWLLPLALVRLATRCSCAALPLVAPGFCPWLWSAWPPEFPPQRCPRCHCHKQTNNQPADPSRDQKRGLTNAFWRALAARFQNSSSAKRPAPTTRRGKLAQPLLALIASWPTLCKHA